MVRDRRKYVLVGTRRDAWRRAKGRCEDCGKALIERVMVSLPGRRIEFKIRLWNGYECWRCHNSTRVLMVFRSDDYGESYVERRDLGEAIRRNFPFFYADYSNTMDRTYYANHCENCGALLGDHYVLHWAMENGDGWDNPGLVQEVPGVRQIEAAHSYTERRFLPFHIHHEDSDPSNNSVRNLKILCVECHQRIHAERPITGQDSSPAL